MKTKVILLMTIFIITGFFNGEIQAENKTQKIINSKIRNDTIGRLCEMLNDYVYPKTGKKVIKQLKRNLKDGKYNLIKDFRKFARIVSKNMFEVSKDKHLIIRYSPKDVKEIKWRMSLPEKDKNKAYIKEKKNYARRNFGFKETKILPGNIGYIKFNSFNQVKYAGDTASAAIRFLENTDAMIIDLRNNNGGWSCMVQLLCSYFFEYKESFNNLLLFESHFPYLNKIIQYSVLPKLPSQRLLYTPVYILTGSNTYSAAERFVITMQQLGRAKIIGERTRGGGTGTRGPEVLNNYYIVKMPVSFSTNPYSNVKWEGVGIEPDIKKKSKESLDTALKMIIKEKIKKKSNGGFINSLGYGFLSDGKIDMAIYIFKENVNLHPKSANAYDSLGEGYMLKDNIELAIKNYKISLELNPENKNAAHMLVRLSKMNKKKNR